MSDRITCPSCGNEFAVGDALRVRLECDVRHEVQLELQAKFAEARALAEVSVARERDLLRKEAELAAKAQEADLVRERQLADARSALQTEATKRADERAALIVAKERDDLALREQRLAAEREKLVKALESAREAANGAAARETKFLEMERTLLERERDMSLEVERKLSEERKRIEAAARKRAHEAAALEVRAATEQAGLEAAARVERAERELEIVRSRAAAADERELAFLREKEVLGEKLRQMDLEVEKRLVDERERIRRESEANAAQRVELVAEQSRLREKEHEDRLGQLQRTVEALQQKLAQGSQQTQGEAQELVLRDALVGAFPADRIVDVPKGTRGADLSHHVCNADGEECGTIVWESKRTQAWSNAWLEKVRDDLREAGGAVAVIVSQALPPGLRTFEFRDGVWICSWSYAAALASALRSGILDVHRVRRASAGRDSKMVRLYDYLNGDDFRNRVKGVIESMVMLRADIETERRAFTRIWKRREQMVERALQQMSSVCGSLEGIAALNLDNIDALALSGVGPAAALDTESSIRRLT